VLNGVKTLTLNCTTTIPPPCPNTASEARGEYFEGVAVAEQSSSADEEVTDDPERGTSPASNATTSAPNGVDESEAGESHQGSKEDEEDPVVHDLTDERREDDDKKVKNIIIPLLNTYLSQRNYHQNNNRGNEAQFI